MKNKKYKEKLETSITKKKEVARVQPKYKWIIKIILITFLISVCLSLISEIVIPNVYFIISIILVLFFIFLGIIFDIIGVAITTADKKIFHSMATKKIKGSKTAIKFINKKDEVASFCNDVVGDICGVISGSCGLSIAIEISKVFNFNLLITTVLITSIISSLTIRGKAIGKSYAVNKNNAIVYQVSKIISIFCKN